MKKSVFYIGLVIMACIGLNIIGYVLPITKGMSENVIESAKILMDEGEYPEVMGMNNSKLDNFTDSLIINIATYFGDEKLLNKVFANYYWHSDVAKTKAEGLLLCNKENEKITKREYSRYWHGYIVFVKGALLFTNYAGIRELNSMLQITMFVLVLMLLMKRNQKGTCIAYSIFYILLNPIALSLSLQFSAIYYVVSIAVIILLLGYEIIKKYSGIYTYFLIIGIITNWVDFLTYPIITLGIPLTIYLVLEYKSNVKKQVISVLTISALWGAGYCGMWMLKWILGCIILKQNVFFEAIQRAVLRTGAFEDGETWSRWDVFNKNFEHFKHKSLYLLFGCSVIYACVSKKSVKNISLRKSVPFILITLMPVIWYGVLSNHSWIHHWFTFRNLTVAFFAIFCFLFQKQRE